VDALTRHRLARLDLDAGEVASMPVPARVDAVHRAFVRTLPCETLSRVLERRARPAAPATWMRGTDRVLRDHGEAGTGGCCFELAYALAAILRGVGAVAHPTIGRRLLGGEAHAAVLVFRPDGAYLHDPATLVSRGLPVRAGGGASDGLSEHALESRGGATWMLVERSRGGARVALHAFVAIPAPADGYRRAWIDACAAQPDGAVVIARRREDRLERFDEASARVEVTTADGTRTEELGPDPVRDLHARFGIAESRLRALASARTSRA
jgi:hypothetical protein